MGLFPAERNLAVSPDRVELLVRSSDFRLKAHELELRLDAFLTRHLTWRSRSSVQALIKEGSVLVMAPSPERPGRPGDRLPDPVVERRPARLLRDGARVTVLIPEELRLPEIAGDSGELTVLYEDEDLIAVDKPPLLPVHPSGRHLGDTLIQRLHARFARSLDEADRTRAKIPVRLCHRLDRETSGLVLCAKRRAPHRKVMLQFERRQVEKEYLAIVHGSPADDEGVIDYPLGPALTSAVRLKIAVSSEGLPSRTEWRVLERYPRHSLLACRPRTGRQHQLRVHLDAIGHPLVGDKLYGTDEAIFLRAANAELTDQDRGQLELPRHALHNHRLCLRRPFADEGTDEWLELESPLAPDLRAFLEAAGDAR